MNQIKRIAINWRTSSGGITGIIIGSVCLIEAFRTPGPIDKDVLATNAGLIGLGISSLFSRDSSVTSEQCGFTPSQNLIDKACEVDSPSVPTGAPNP